MALGGALENFDHAGEVDDVWLVVETPLVSVHEAVVGFVHLLVHPDGVGDVETDGHAEFGAFFKKRIDKSAVGMEAHGFRFAGDQAFAFVVDFADAASASVVAAFQFADGGGAESGLVVASEIETAPQLEAVGIL
jgi:hypothetical protein